MCLNAAHMRISHVHNNTKKRRIYTTLQEVGGRGDAPMCKQMISCFNFKGVGSPIFVNNYKHALFISYSAVSYSMYRFLIWSYGSSMIKFYLCALSQVIKNRRSYGKTGD